MNTPRLETERFVKMVDKDCGKSDLSKSSIVPYIYRKRD